MRAYKNFFNRIRKILAHLLLCSGTCLNAQEASYGSLHYYAETPGFLYLSGEIHAATDFELRRALRDYSVHTLVLDSNGGNVWGGLSTAGIAHNTGLRTYVPNDSTCASACTFIYLAGLERRASGRVGVHQFTSQNDDEIVKLGEVERKTQAVTSEVLGFLRDFDAPPFVAERMLRSREMYWFRDFELDMLATEVFGVTKGQISDVNRLTTQLRKATTQAANKPSEAEIIIAVQRRLNKLGCNAGPEDGIIGWRTLAAVRRFADIVGLQYSQGLIFEEAFLEKLVAVEDSVCPPQGVPTEPSTSTDSPTIPPPSEPIPRKFAKHWEIKCRAADGSTIFKVYARLQTYNSSNGSFQMIFRDMRGAKELMIGSVRAGKIQINDRSGQIDSTFTRFSIRTERCPGNILAVALL